MEVVVILLLMAGVTFLLSSMLLKAASDYKKTFGKSLWPGILAMCLAFDLLIAIVYSQEEDLLLPALVCAVLLLGYAVYRDIRHYKNRALGAMCLQLVFALLQAGVFTIILIGISVARLRKQQKEVLGLLQRLFQI